MNETPLLPAFWLDPLFHVFSVACKVRTRFQAHFKDKENDIQRSFKVSSEIQLRSVGCQNYAFNY